ncbi:hypothetical protein Lser_V15G24332 [Lactuca serriola]
MNPKKNDHPINPTPTLQIDAATFQAAVSAVVSAILTHLNANNASVSKIAINHSNPSNNLAPQRPTNYHGTPSAEAKINS